jgi:hypothetical protein
MRRLLLFVGVLAALLLAAEGALSLCSGRSLRDLGGARQSHRLASPSPPAKPAPAVVGRGGVPPGADAAPADEPGAAASGMYALHDDPLVGYVLQPDADIRWGEALVSTDHLACAGAPPPPDDALRLVVLGDSVAFGFGVDDEQALAARLEARLAELRGPDERPVACRTVAIPSWNHRAAAAFLLDHWDELRPDLVLYLPIGNDVRHRRRRCPGRRRIHRSSSPDLWLCAGGRRRPSTSPAAARHAGRPDSESANALHGPLRRVAPAAIQRRDHRRPARSSRRAAAASPWSGPRCATTSTRSCPSGGDGARTSVVHAADDDGLKFTLGDDPHPNALTLTSGALAGGRPDRALLPRARPSRRRLRRLRQRRVASEPAPADTGGRPTAARPLAADGAAGDRRADAFRLGQVLGGLNPT